MGWAEFQKFSQKISSGKLVGDSAARFGRKREWGVVEFRNCGMLLRAWEPLSQRLLTSVLLDGEYHGCQVNALALASL